MGTISALSALHKQRQDEKHQALAKGGSSYPQLMEEESGGTSGDETGRKRSSEEGSSNGRKNRTEEAKRDSSTKD